MIIYQILIKNGEFMQNNFEKQAEIVLYHADNSDVSINALKESKLLNLLSPNDHLYQDQLA